MLFVKERVEKIQNIVVGNIDSGFEKVLSDNDALVKNLEMLPVECVVRNYAAGGIVRRYGVSPQMEFKPPLYSQQYDFH